MKQPLPVALALCGTLFVATTPTANAAERPDLSTVRQVLDQRYHMHGQSVPMMGLVSGIAWAYTHGGVRAMKVVTYEHFRRPDDPAEMTQLIRTRLDDAWSLMVRQRATARTGEKDTGEEDMVWVQPHGKRMRMLVINLEGDELNLVQVELSPEALAKWKKQHGG